MDQIENILSIARQYIGTKEYPGGSNNVIFNTKYYGKTVSGKKYPWCMSFVWFLFYATGIPKLFFNGKKTASCGTLMRWAKSVGQFVTSNFMPGDVLFFDFSGKKGQPEHTGIYEYETDEGVFSIEGNTGIGNNSNGGEVMRRCRDMKYIIGAFRPKYEIAQEEDDMTGKEIYEALNEYLASQPCPDWALAEFDEAVKLGITDGTTPMGLVPRYVAAIMSKRVYKKAIER